MNKLLGDDDKDRGMDRTHVLMGEARWQRMVIEPPFYPPVRAARRGYGT